MAYRSMSGTTALVAVLSLVLPQATFVPAALAQDRIRLCQDLETTPPCPRGEPRRGTTYELGEEGDLVRAPRGNGENNEEGGGGRRAEREERAQAEAEAEAEAQIEAEAEDAQGAQDARRAERDAEARAEAEAEDAQRAEQARRAEREAEAQFEAEAEDAQRAQDARRAERDAEARAEAEAEDAQRAEQARRAERDAEAQFEAEAEEARQDRENRRAEREARAQADAEEDARSEAVAIDERSYFEEEVEIVEDRDVRSSDEDFLRGERRDREANEESDDDGLSNFEKALLLGLGAIAVGSLLDDGNEVVSNSGDRVVTRDGDGFYTVYRDDDALLRQEGATVRTQTFDDGSTRSIVERDDGTQIVTIRSAEGRVLRRARVLPDGTQVVLLDDTEEAEPVDIRTLVERAPAPIIVSVDDVDGATLRQTLDSGAVYDPGRTFTLRQIREISAVRSLVPGIDLDAITFASGSAAIPSAELVSLVEMGILIEEALDRDPSEVFLIEGHTDAMGSEAANLALSDRRAETVALALTENFAIPPENLVIQGYGEEFLKVPTLSDEQENRRATIRRITPLLQG